MNLVGNSNLKIFKFMAEEMHHREGSQVRTRQGLYIYNKLEIQKIRSEFVERVENQRESYPDLSYIVSCILCLGTKQFCNSEFGMIQVGNSPIKLLCLFTLLDSSSWKGRLAKWT